MDSPALPPVVNDAITAVCQVSHTEHVAIIFVVQLVVQFTFGLVNYFGFTKNPNVKSSTMFEAIINIIKALVARRAP